MADGTVRSWAQELLARDVEAFSKARRDFLRRPSVKNLHDVRTASRRLRSVLDDLASVVGPKDLRDLRRAIHASGTSRDAGILRKIVKRELARDEKAVAKPYVRALGDRKEKFKEKAIRRMRRIDVEAL